MAITKRAGKYKSADFQKARDYLKYDHDEITKEPLLDKNGNLVERQGAILTPWNCDSEEDFILQSTLLIKKYVGQNPNALKQFQYIIGYDPQDIEEGKLTPELAHEISMKIYQRVFPDMIGLAATHLDGDKHNNPYGYYHTHLSICAVRYKDKNPEDWMVKKRGTDEVQPNQYKAGYKHRETPEFQRFYKEVTMQICEEYGLRQVNLFKNDKKQFAEDMDELSKLLKEKEQNGNLNDEKQKRVDHLINRWNDFQEEKKNKKSESEVVAKERLNRNKSKQQTLTRNEYIKVAAESCLKTSTSFKEFQDQMLYEYDITVKKTRGAASYGVTTKNGKMFWTRDRRLGTDYNMESLQNHFKENKKLQRSETSFGHFVMNEYHENDLKRIKENLSHDEYIKLAYQDCIDSSTDNFIFKTRMEKKYGIEVKLTEDNLYFLHPDKKAITENYISAEQLGEYYNKKNYDEVIKYNVLQNGKAKSVEDLAIQEIRQSYDRTFDKYKELDELQKQLFSNKAEKARKIEEYENQIAKLQKELEWKQFKELQKNSYDNEFRNRSEYYVRIQIVLRQNRNVIYVKKDERMQAMVDKLEARVKELNQQQALERKINACNYELNEVKQNFNEFQKAQEQGTYNQQNSNYMYTNQDDYQQTLDILERKNDGFKKELEDLQKNSVMYTPKEKIENEIRECKMQIHIIKREDELKQFETMQKAKYDNSNSASETEQNQYNEIKSILNKNPMNLEQKDIQDKINELKQAKSELRNEISNDENSIADFKKKMLDEGIIVSENADGQLEYKHPLMRDKLNETQLGPQFSKMALDEKIKIATRIRDLCFELGIKSEVNEAYALYGRDLRTLPKWMLEDRKRYTYDNDKNNEEINKKLKKIEQKQSPEEKKKQQEEIKNKIKSKVVKVIETEEEITQGNQKQKNSNIQRL